MKKLQTLLVATAFALSGCGAGTAISLEASPSTPPTFTPTSVPTVLTTEEAGKAYLAAVCPSNIQAHKTSEVVQAEPFDLQASKTATAALRDTYRATIEKLTNDKTLWPGTVKADIEALTELMYDDLSGTENVAKQKTQTDFTSSWNSWTSSMADRPGTAQKIRLKLGLSADTASSCASP
ncbi:hypothetical protein [Paenarthrobacter sp. FR1]|uniref:hypothetical protein n=1 Tax=Paenarthrobacter sp. FR1 TaxID=3439548 RepID=UPI003DA61DD6